MIQQRNHVQIILPRRGLSVLGGHRDVHAPIDTPTKYCFNILIMKCFGGKHMFPSPRKKPALGYA